MNLTQVVQKVNREHREHRECARESVRESAMQIMVFLDKFMYILDANSEWPVVAAKGLLIGLAHTVKDLQTTFDAETKTLNTL